MTIKREEQSMKRGGVDGLSKLPVKRKEGKRVIEAERATRGKRLWSLSMRHGGEGEVVMIKCRERYIKRGGVGTFLEVLGAGRRGGGGDSVVLTFPG